MPHLVDLGDDGLLDVRWLVPEVAHSDTAGEIQQTTPTSGHYPGAFRVNDFVIGLERKQRCDYFVLAGYQFRHVRLLQVVRPTEPVEGKKKKKKTSAPHSPPAGDPYTQIVDIENGPVIGADNHVVVVGEQWRRELAVQRCRVKSHACALNVWATPSSPFNKSIRCSCDVGGWPVRRNDARTS